MDAPTKFTFFLLKLVNAKKLASKTMLDPKRSKKFKFPRRLKKYKVEQFLVHRRNVVTFASHNSTTNKHIVFLHGGGYTVEVQKNHWWMLEQMLKKSECKLSFIEYPLAPEHNYTQAHAMLAEAWFQLTKKYPDDTFYLLGDSAGAGFCLAFAQTLRDNNSHKRPEKIALLSPWLDLSMSNPEIAQLEPKDLLLSSKTLKQCAKWFASDLDLKSPKVSPLFADLNNLSSIGIFVGTHEILLPDCRLLKQKIQNTNTYLHYQEYSEMQHDFGIFPIKERNILLRDLVDYFS